ncbi:MAG: hypothetical protein ACI38Q_09830 [Candidatus Bruticola sp.]
MRNLTVRELTFTAMLTCCNSVSELVIGTLLHIINFSMKGSVLVGLNVMVYTVLFSRIPRFGIITLCGLGTAAVNFLITGGFKFFALYCIVLEALVVDIIFSVFKFNRGSIIASCIAAGLTACLCGFANAFLFLGIDLEQALQRLSQSSLTVGQPLAAIVAFIVGWRVLAGVVFGLIACKVIRLLSPEINNIDAFHYRNEQEVVDLGRSNAKLKVEDSSLNG